MFQRLRDKVLVYKDIVSEGIAIIGVVAIVIAMFIPEQYVGVIKYALITALIIVVLMFAVLRRTQHLGALDAPSAYFINVPCAPAELDAAIQIAQYYFGSQSMKPDMVRAAYRVNPFSFIVIKDSAHKVVGYFDYYGLMNASFDKFLAGKLCESEMTQRDFVGGDEIMKAKRIYIGGIALRTRSKYESGKLTKCLLNVACELLVKRYLVEDIEIDLYASGFSKEGRDMLVSLGFGKLIDGKNRPDGHPLYWRKVNRKIASRYRRDNPTCKSEIFLKWDESPAMPHKTARNRRLLREH